MRLNPIALIFWVFCALVGFLVDGTTGAVWGAVLSMGLSFLLQII